MSAIVLWDTQGLEHSYTESQTDLSSHTFVAAQVNSGTWIVYEETNYNNASQGRTKFMKLEPGEKKDLPDLSPRSIWEATATSNAVTLFEFVNYAGLQRHAYLKATPDVTKDFPKTVSSMIIWPVRDWNLYEKPNYQGGSKDVQPGWYPNGDFPANKLASIAPVQ